MENSVAARIAELPPELQSAADLWFAELADRGAVLPDDLLAPVCRFIACSEFAAKVLLQELPWFVENVASFGVDAAQGELNAFVTTIADSDADVARVKSKLRRFRNRYLLRILWREIQHQVELDETLQQLSLLADRILDAVTKYAEKQMRPRFGQLRNTAAEVVPLVILGMGKLGGRELNFSSDIDIIFCYSANGESDGDRSLSAQEYFTRLSRLVIALIAEVTADGFVFRVDTRLRPFGDSGPPVVSFSALESYLLQHGRAWERYAYIKARIVGWQPSAAIANELCADLIRPFVYRRYLDYGVFESIREMHEMLATDVRRRDLADNIKLGPGGIREAEFVVQALQLVRGGREPELQCNELQTVLPLLVNHRGISATDAADIRSAYRYLRRLENFIQAIRDEQTHDLPDHASVEDRSRLCLAMNYENWDGLLHDLNQHRAAITARFNAIAFRGEHSGSSIPQSFVRLWEARASKESWSGELPGGDASALAEVIVSFASLSLTQQLDSVSAERLQRFIPRLIERAIASDRPVDALSRTLNVIESILRRSAYLALLNENQRALSRLVDLCARSTYIAGQIARHPVLLDELLDPQIYSAGMSKDNLFAELQQRLIAAEGADSEARMQTIAKFQRATMFRIAVADFNDQLPIMKVSDGLTWLAEVVLDAALSVAWQDLVERHGVPRFVVDGASLDAGFGIVAYGKLGGLELSYGSDLDIVFLHDSSGEQQQTDGDKPLDNSMFFGRLVRRLVHFLSTQTGSGELYEIDTRLRPDGRSGLLVTSTESFERYQEENAWTWEHQALLRARPVAGSARIAREFERIRRETLTNRVHRDKLRDDVIAMRRKMRQELDRSDKAVFDLKHGSGGLGDIEFLVQYLVLKAADSYPDVISYSDNVRQLDALVAADLLEQTTGERLQDIYRGYRLHVHHLVLDGQNALCDAERFGPERDFVAAIWKDRLD